MAEHVGEFAYAIGEVARALTSGDFLLRRVAVGQVDRAA